MPNSDKLSALALKRRTTFASKMAALNSYCRRPPFSVFQPRALSLYVEHGFATLPSALHLASEPSS